MENTPSVTTSHPATATPVLNELALNLEKPLSPEDLSVVQKIKSEIKLDESNFILQYGAAAQSRMSQFSESMIAEVRNKDLGKVGDILGSVVVTIKNFDTTTASKKGFFASMFSNVKKQFDKVVVEYSKAETNVNALEKQLEKIRYDLTKDIYSFDQLFEKNLEYFKTLSLYILAGEEKLAEEQLNLAQLQQEAQRSKDPMVAEKYQAFAQRITRFEKRLHDLKLSRIIALQTAPQIRMVQSNDIILSEKIQSTILNTIPLWKNQIALTLGISRIEKAVAISQMVDDATNKLLQTNSEILKQSSISVAQQSERGMADLETVQKVNADIISTIENVLNIQKEGKEKRRTVEIELSKAESELKNALQQNRQ